jgi:hypothetical protein
MAQPSSRALDVMHLSRCLFYFVVTFAFARDMTVHIPLRLGLICRPRGLPGRKLPMLDCEVVGKSILARVPRTFKLRTCTQEAVTTPNPETRESRAKDWRYCGSKGTKGHDAFPINAVLVSGFVFWSQRIDLLSLATTSVQFACASLQQMNVEQVDGSSQKCKE